ncbi:MAG: hypothetical protein QM731_12525 [Chitinophagaceae bacterium]
MKWTLISKPANTLQEYHLVQDGEIKAVIKYNPAQQTVRISDPGKQRLLFLERTGFWNKQTVLQNEYGVNIGRLQKDPWNGNVGVIDIDGHHYNYSITQGNSLPELVIYEKDITSPLATCNLQEPSGFSLKKDIQKYTNLLLGLCWCVLAPITSRTVTPPQIQLGEFNIL